MKLKITKTVNAKDCTSDFVDDSVNFDIDYFIAKIGVNGYALVEKNTNKVLEQFESIEKITDKIWLLNIEGDKKRLIDVSKYTPNLSIKFLKVIKLFEDYILVELEDAERILLERSTLKETNDVIFTDQYALLELSNGNYTIVERYSLQVADIEIDLDEQTFN